MLDARLWIICRLRWMFRLSSGWTRQRESITREATADAPFRPRLQDYEQQVWSPDLPGLFGQPEQRLVYYESGQARADFAHFADARHQQEDVDRAEAGDLRVAVVFDLTVTG